MTASPSTSSSRARSAPKESSLWLRAQNMNQLANLMQEHPLRIAWLSACELEAPLTRTLRNLTGTIRDLAVRQGLEQRLFDALWNREVELSVQTTKEGRTFLLMLDAGEHESLVQDFVDRLEAIDRTSTTRRIAHPFGCSGFVFVGFAGTRLLISNDRATLQGATMRSVRTADLESAADSSSLAADPTFVAAGVESDRKAWLQGFVRGSETWLFDALEEAKLLPAFAAKSIRMRTKAISFELRNEAGFLATSMRFNFDGGPVLPFLTQKRPDPRLARMIPGEAQHWLAVGYEPSGMLDLLMDSDSDLKGLGRVSVLDKDIVAVLPQRSLRDITSSLAPSMLSIVGDSQNPDLDGLVLLVENDASLRATLDAIASKRHKPGSSERALHRYRIDRAGASLYATLVDDMLLIATTEARESALLERALSGEADAAVAQRFAANDGRYWLIGSESARHRFEAADPNDEQRLRACAQHFDVSRVRGELGTNHFTIEGRGATGAAHLTATVLASTLPSFIDGLDTEQRDFVLSCGADVLDAAKRFTSEARIDRDRDGRGEPVGIAELRNAKLFSSKQLQESKGEIVEVRGYRLTLVFPSELDVQEEHWAVLAWPIQPGISGDRCWLMRNDGRIYVATRLPELDPGSGPTTKQIFGEVIWSDQPTSAWTWTNEAVEVVEVAQTVNDEEASKALDPTAATTEGGRPSGVTEPETTQPTTAEPIGVTPGDDATKIEAPKVAGGQDTGEHPAAVQPEALLSEAQKRLRADQARTLEVAGAKKDSATLMGFLTHEDENFRARAAWFLGQEGVQEAIPRIARILHDDTSKQARRAAAQALAKMRDAMSRASLARALSDEDPKVRLFCATGLIGSKDKATTKALVDLVIAFPEDSEGDRTQAILAIADAKDASHLEAFTTLEAKTKPSADAFAYAFQTLSPTLDAATEAKVLTQALASPTPSVREYAIRRIAAAGHASALSVLEKRLHEEDASLRPLIETAIASFQETPKTDWLALAKTKGEEAIASFKTLPIEAQYGIAAAPLVLLILLVLWRTRSRRARKNASMDLVGPSSDAGPAPSLRSGTPREFSSTRR